MHIYMYMWHLDALFTRIVFFVIPPDKKFLRIPKNTRLICLSYWAVYMLRLPALLCTQLMTRPPFGTVHERIRPAD